MALRLLEIFGKGFSTRRRQFVTLLAFLFILSLLLILAAPVIVSSDFAQNRLKSALSTTLQGPVNWSSLQLSWRKGLQLHDLTVTPATGVLRQVRLAEIICRPGFGFGAKPGESFGFDLFLRLYDLQVELAPVAAPTPSISPPPSAVEKIDPLTALAQGLDRFASLSWPLPIDLRADVAISPFILSFNDTSSGRHLRFAEGDLQVMMSSLEQAPLKVRLNGVVEIDKDPIGHLRLVTEVAGLVAPTGRIVPVGALLSVFVDFPGLLLKADGRLDQEQGLQGELRLDIPQLQKVSAPFLSAAIPQLGGSLLATLHAQVDKEKDLSLLCTLDGKDLSAAAIGPLNLSFGQQVRSHHLRQIVTFDQGFLIVPQLVNTKWEASVKDPSSPQRLVSAQLQELDIDLDRLLTLAAPFLPPDLPQLSNAQVRMCDLELQLRGSQGDGDVHLGRAEVLLPSLRPIQPQSMIAGKGIEVVASDISLPLKAYFPTSVSAEIAWKVAGLSLRGAQSLILTDLAGHGNLSISELRKSEGEGKISANGRFDHQLQMKGAEAPGLARLSTLANDLHLVFALLPDGGIKVGTLEVNTDIAALTATIAGKELQPLPLRQTLQVAGVALHPNNPFPLVNNVAFSVTSPGLLEISGAGSLATARLLTLSTKLRLELPRLIALARPLLPEKLTASGALSTALNLVATLPEHPLQSGQAPLRSVKNALVNLQELSGELQLDDIELRLPLANGNLHLSGIKTLQPLRLQSAQNGAKIDFAGAIASDLLPGSIISGKELPVEHGQITFSGEVLDWERAFLAETLQVEPFGLAQRSELTITGLAALLDQTLPPSPATLLQRLDATLFSEIDLHIRPDAPQLLPEMTVTGKTAAGSRIDLHGGKSLRLHAYADLAELDVLITKGPQLHGLQAHLNFERTLQISTGTTRKEHWLPLSTSLIQPRPLSLPPPLEGAKRRLHDDLRGNSGKERSLSIQSLILPGLTLPLTITALEAEIATGQEELGMNFLQAELLGGTLRARALLDLRPTVPVVRAEALFTNIDLSRLGSSATELPSDTDENSISGEGFIRVPLRDEQRPLLEGLTLAARLRHIGARSFDRALASLDPYERNEAIMAQRKLLRHGQLQGVEVEAADGALALSGTVSLKGVTVPLPKIDRLRLAEFPLNKELAPLINAISTIRPPLEFLRADTIDIGAQGEISLRKEEK